MGFVHSWGARRGALGSKKAVCRCCLLPAACCLLLPAAARCLLLPAAVVPAARALARLPRGGWQALPKVGAFLTAVEALPGVGEYLAARPECVDIGTAPMLRARA